jgi:hypothetical protein
VTAGLQLGRPGVYLALRRADDPLSPVRLDIAGFVGVALRGPVDIPVAVTSWSEYELIFGGYERPAGAPERMLPLAVSTFFAQGGNRAYVVRVAPPPSWSGPSGDDATALFELDHPSGYRIRAANEGSWGTTLSIRVEFEVSQTFQVGSPSGVRIALPPGAAPADQSLLRIRREGLPGNGVLRVLTRLTAPALAARFADLDTVLPEPPDGTAPTIDVDVITAAVVASDPSSAVRRDERIGGLGIVAGHPRFIGTTLGRESALCRPEGRWDSLLPDPYLRPILTKEALVHSGVDRSYGITYESFFDDGDADDDLLDEQDTHRGADGLGRVTELGLITIPDLTWQAEQPPDPPSHVVPRPPSHCDLCEPVPEPEPAAVFPVPAALDGRDPTSLAEIVRRQQRLVQIADLRRRFVALLDVPLGLPVRMVTTWRAHFDSAFAAAYYPWLGIAAPSTGAGSTVGAAVSVPPSAFAAGIIAARERSHGVAWGPANEIGRGAVVSRDVVTDAVHDRLHLMGINVFRAERDGFRLSAARTLASDPNSDYRQLSVRRLITSLEEALVQQCQWLVFEPNTAELRTRLTHAISLLLRDLHRRGYLAGATEEESYFVRCDDSNNPVQSQELGRLVAEVGVAPAAPLEYIVLQISADVDGNVTLEAPRG